MNKVIYDVVIVGAGLTGLQVALQAKKADTSIKYLVLEHEKQAGGYFSRLFKNNNFLEENELLNQAEKADLNIRYSATVLGVTTKDNFHQLKVQTSEGLQELKAEKIILCTGALEKPRESLQIPGSRPAGIMTSKMVLGLLERGYLPGSNVVVFNHDKFTDETTKLLRENGAVAEQFNSASTKLKKIYGNSRLESIDIVNKNTKQIINIPCDTLVYSKGYIPATFYLDESGIHSDDNGFIKINEWSESNVPNIYALGICTTLFASFNLFSKETKKVIEEMLDK